ncbi:MAG: GNAT family N-acetyltransferase [Clostridia bacterium]|nr:GNAT family N-acetyltransferase [Clostridia bacterium]
MYISEKFEDGILEKIRLLYESSFPKEEKKPFSLMLKKRDEGLMRFFSILSEDGELLGFMLTVHHGRITLLDYFAIEPASRCKGVGSLALSELLKEYPYGSVVVEIEDERIPSSDQDLRIRRKNFYLRSGLKIMPYNVSLYGVKMRVLTSGQDIPFEEYRALYREVFGEKAEKNVILL